MKAIACFAAIACVACSSPPGEAGGRNTDFDAPCVEFFKSKSPKVKAVEARDSFEKRGMVVVELAPPVTQVNPAVKGAVPDSPAAARHAPAESPALGHCIVDPADGSMRLSSAYDHSWDKDAP